MDINLEDSQRLEEGIAANLWNTDQRTETPLCLMCGAAVSTKAEFHKFAYLPEVLMFSITYVARDATNVAGAHLTYPETLDMSNLRDDPMGFNGAADRDCLYKLQSIVASPNQQTPMDGDVGTHFIPYLRRDETTWTLLNDCPRTIQTVNIDFIRSNTYRPKLIMYVRVHPPDPVLQDEDLADRSSHSSRNESDGDDAFESDRSDVRNVELTDRDEDASKDGRETEPPRDSLPRRAGLQSPGPGPSGNGGPAPGPFRDDAMNISSAETSKPAEVVQRPEEEEEEKDIETGEAQTGATPEYGLVGPLENDADLYRPDETLAPERLMDIIRAAGLRRRRRRKKSGRLGTGSAGGERRGSLGGIRRSAIASMAASSR